MRKIPTWTIKRVSVAGLFLAATLASCSKRDTPASSVESTADRPGEVAAEPDAPTGTAAFDACKLLSNEEIASIQGEAPARTQLVGESSGQLSVSQCNFLLPSGSNSMAVRVIERGNGPSARDPKEVWHETFQRPALDAASARYAKKHEKVEGVGEEAFWLGNAKSGGLHVLTGNRYIRVNAGGQEEIPAKIEKCSKLAELILPRLNAEK
ncbi:MAG: hypothetical protein AVDCRST_MAG42-1878 [uncultured Chthoniobacterales bacterium]|uniref:DUF3558 domain-containing protein n=1 Tax=uncultured Chthoniobacterales bacterium TaxID=1836801 RepID=A0A6J4I7J8_9BACT|nr:MAG: hypothetical protein AVDCRST_MAG42-1878 [uncultured Chthoniobacterales bacterium]